MNWLKDFWNCRWLVGFWRQVLVLDLQYPLNSRGSLTKYLMILVCQSKIQRGAQLPSFMFVESLLLVFFLQHSLPCLWCLSFPPSIETKAKAFLDDDIVLSITNISWIRVTNKDYWIWVSNVFWYSPCFLFIYFWPCEHARHYLFSIVFLICIQ